jgi:competence protein ComEC
LISLQHRCTHHLLTFSTISYGGGILLNSTPIFSDFLLLTTLSGCVAGFIVLRFSGRRDHASLLVPLLFMIFGMIQSSENNCTPVDSSHLVVSVEDDQELVLVGTLAEMVAEYQDTSRAVIELKYVKTHTSQPFTESTGRILLVVEGSWPGTISPGQSIIVRAMVQIPRPASVPGSFDYRKYLARKNIFLTGLVKSPALIQPVGDLETDLQRVLFYQMEKLRAFIAGCMESTLAERDASLYKALLIGDRSSISPDVSEILKRAGIMHLWAISGMHLGLLAMLSYTIIYWLLRRSQRFILAFNVKKAALLLTLPLLLFYALLAGFQPPAARAFIMTSCVVGALCWDRSHSAIAPLSGAALVILLVDPMAIESPSFQLSFAAVSAIILGAPRLSAIIRGLLYRLRNPARAILNLVASILGITILATLGTLPLLLFHFNRLSLVTLPANLLIQPLICFFSLPLGMLSLPFILCDHPAAIVLLKLGAWGLNVSHTIAATLAVADTTQLWAPTPSPTLILVYYVLLISLASRGLSRSAYIFVLVFWTGVLGFLLDRFQLPVTFNDPAARITVLNVGHGSANIIELSTGRVVLIDGGAQSRTGFDCGARLIGPYLWHEGIGRIDDIFITHDDADHYSGISTLIKRFKPQRLWLPHLSEAKEGYSRLVGLARREGIRIILPEPGVVISEAGSQMSLLGGDIPMAIKNEDDHGLVLKLKAGKTSMLFPGDITIRREFELIGSGEDLRSTILLSPHHGSATSNSLELLSAVSPEWLIISNGISRISHFPAKETLNTAQKLGIPVLNTAIDGTIAITMFSDAKGYRLVRETTQRQYWRSG